MVGTIQAIEPDLITGDRADGGCPGVLSVNCWL